MVKYIGKIVLGEDMYHIKDIEARTNLIDKSEKGAASGVATLDANGKVPSSLLPSYVDDVVEGYYHDGNFYNTFTPGEDPDPDTYSDLITPETGIIYVDKSTNYTYRWSGSVYIMIGSPDDNEEVQIGGNTPTDPGIKLYVDEEADPATSFDVYTRYETDTLLATKADSDDVYTKGQTDTLLDGKLSNPIELASLSADYTFKEGDTIAVGTGIYKCTAETTTLSPFNFVFDANGSIVVDSVNGYEAYVVDSETLNTGWEKVMDVSDRHYIEMRMAQMDSKKADKATTANQIDALTKYTRKTDFDLNDLKKAVAEQNLEKYGLKVGDRKTINGRTYVIAGLNPMKGTSTSYRVIANHVGLIVIPHTTTKWNASGNTYTGADDRGAGYANSDLHYYLENTLLPLVKEDLGATNLIAHAKIYSNAVNQNGYNKTGEASGCSSGWGWVTNQYISALSEVQVYGGTVWSSSGFDTGEACRQLEVFQKYSHTLIFGDEYPWLRDVVSASHAAYARNYGVAANSAAPNANYVAALILFH